MRRESKRPRIITASAPTKSQFVQNSCNEILKLLLILIFLLVRLFLHGIKIRYILFLSRVGIKGRLRMAGIAARLKHHNYNA
jgi:hypothetical protein